MEICSTVLLFVAVGVVLYLLGSYQRYRKYERFRVGYQDDRMAEEERVRECAEVVDLIAGTLGYIAREVMSREELAERIDAGATGDDLIDDVLGRVAALDVHTLGVHDFARFPVKLSRRYRDRHVYVVGKSGTGKTTLLRHMIMQDMEAGHGLGVIAPEQEMILDELLPFVPEHRVDDVVYFNPADLERPVSFNPLHLDAGEDLDRRVDENVTIFRRLIGGDSSPRIDELMRQSFYALLEMPGATPRALPPSAPPCRRCPASAGSTTPRRWCG